jgi:hypothetical protein
MGKENPNDESDSGDGMAESAWRQGFVIGPGVEKGSNPACLSYKLHMNMRLDFHQSCRN